MSSWRDDLPPIPSDRIREEAIREGTRRRELRQRRQRGALVGGIGAAAVALVVVSGALTGPGDGSVDNASVGTSAAFDTTRAAADLTEPAGTESPAEATVLPEPPAATEAAAATIPPSTTAASETTTIVDYTTIANSLPPSVDVRADPPLIFEQLPGGPICGPSTFEVTFQPQSQALQAPVVHWETNGVTGEAPMLIDGDVARATIGPFAPSTVDEGVSHEVLVLVTDSAASGEELFRSPPVVLRDCPP